ncbi:MAG: fused MFS/spermidine synthase [Acidobacteriota bacterium]|nr:fused MFS/spermidine synthase [Acidobacteriota bacterium]
MLVYAVTIFLSAFLLFLVQPMIGKMILPWFGGSAAVWSACLLYFQLSLLLGYLYAHGISRLTPRRQALIHTLLLLASLAVLPVIPSAAWKPAVAGDPTLRIVGVLAATIGLPYLLLSATGPLLQAWFVAVRPGAIPYRLFALSNLGSMLALLSYPVIVEPALAARSQAWMWSGAYALFALLCVGAAWKMAGRVKAAMADAGAEPGIRPGWKHYAFWILLAACPSGLLLALTTVLSQNVAPIPFLWVLPLAIYLLTFILCFESSRFYSRIVFLPLVGAAVAAMSFTSYYDWNNPPIRVAIPVFGAGLFLCAMACHGELARLKPHPRYLTRFYLAVSFGGALGGLFVAILAPHLFHTYAEFPILLVASLSLLALAVWTVPSEPAGKPAFWILLAEALVLGAIAMSGGTIFGGDRAMMAAIGGCAAATAVIVIAMRRRLDPGVENWVARGGMLALTVWAAVYLGSKHNHDAQRFIRSDRNFYGVLRVRDQPDTEFETGLRALIHGTIYHGSQLSDPQYRRIATTYYSAASGIGRALAALQARGPVRVAVIGLGAGVLASYGRTGDMFRFYEINPLDVTIANTQFTFLKDSPAQPVIALGDARLTLERESPQRFDVLAVDAFSSDSIPVHLLTREAFALYFRHLAPGGVLAVHVSNRYLNLIPVVAGNAAAFGKTAILAYDDGEEQDYFDSSDWMLVTADPKVFEQPEFRSVDTRPVPPSPKFRTWTDDYSNLFQILR